MYASYTQFPYTKKNEEPTTPRPYTYLELIHYSLTASFNALPALNLGALQACDAGRVLVNGSVAKASVKVKVGDIIEIQFGTRTVKVEVLDIQETTKKEEAKDLFKYL